ncbi:MAG: hypothetical protein AB1861_19585 [Cyanobacteriota bacterium]
MRVYRASNPEQPQVYRHGEVAEAEPAVLGWLIAVDDLIYLFRQRIANSDLYFNSL